MYFTWLGRAACGFTRKIVTGRQRGIDGAKAVTEESKSLSFRLLFNVTREVRLMVLAWQAFWLFGPLLCTQPALNL
jgi:hypothetical protein